MKSLHIFTIVDDCKFGNPPPEFVIRTHHVVPWSVDGFDWMNEPESLRAMMNIVAAANRQAKAREAEGLPGVHLNMPIARAVGICHDLVYGPYGKRDGGPFAMLVPDEHYTVKGLQKYLAPHIRDRELWNNARILAHNLSGLKRHLPK